MATRSRQITYGPLLRRNLREALHIPLRRRVCTEEGEGVEGDNGGAGGI